MCFSATPWEIISGREKNECQAAIQICSIQIFVENAPLFFQRSVGSEMCLLWNNENVLLSMKF